MKKHADRYYTGMRTALDGKTWWVCYFVNARGELDSIGRFLTKRDAERFRIKYFGENTIREAKRMSKYHYIGMAKFNHRKNGAWVINYTYGSSDVIREKRGSYEKLMQFASTMENAPMPENTQIWSIHHK